MKHSSKILLCQKDVSFRTRECQVSNNLCEFAFGCMNGGEKNSTVGTTIADRRIQFSINASESVSVELKDVVKPCANIVSA